MQIQTVHIPEAIMRYRIKTQDYWSSPLLTRPENMCGAWGIGAVARYKLSREIEGESNWSTYLHSSHVYMYV